MGIALACNSLYPPERAADARTHWRPAPSQTERIRSNPMAVKNRVETVIDELTNEEIPGPLATPQNNAFGFWSMNPQFLPPAFVTAEEKRMLAQEFLTFTIHKVRIVNTQYGPTWWLWIDWGKGQLVLSLQDDADGTRHDMFSAMQAYLETQRTPVKAIMTLSILSNGNEFFNIVPPTDAIEPQPDNHMDDVPF